MAMRKNANPTRTPPPLSSIGGGGGGGGVPVMTVAKRQPVILKDPAVARSVTRCAEAAASCAANCAAVCCCWPCGLVSLFVLATVRLPAGLCRRALSRLSRRRKALANQKRMEPVLLERKTATSVIAGLIPAEAASSLMSEKPMVVALALGLEGLVTRSPEAKLEEIEKEMWTNFYSTGFWRSLSTREEEEEEQQPLPSR